MGFKAIFLISQSILLASCQSNQSGQHVERHPFLKLPINEEVSKESKAKSPQDSIRRDKRADVQSWSDLALMNFERFIDSAPAQIQRISEVQQSAWMDAESVWNSPELAALRELVAPGKGGTKKVVSAADFDGDGTSDLMFVSITADGNLEYNVYCWAQQSKTAVGGTNITNTTPISYNECMRGVMVGALPTGASLHSIVTSDFNLDGFPDVLSIASYKNQAGNGTSRYAFSLFLQNHSAEPAKFSRKSWDSLKDMPANKRIMSLPFAVDINRDGFLDLIVDIGAPSQPTRHVLVSQRGLSFDPIRWTDLGEYIDFQDFSSVPKYDISKIPNIGDFTSKFASLARHVRMQHNGSIPIPGSNGDQGVNGGTNEKRSYLSWLNPVNWFRGHSGPSAGAAGSDESKLATDEKSARAHPALKSFLIKSHVELQTNSIQSRLAQKQLRVPDLLRPPPMSGAPFHVLADVNGDCISDLILTVESRMQPGRTELEIWLTELVPVKFSGETEGTHNVIKWRYWSGQRIVLPPDVVSISVDDFSGDGRADISLLACTKSSVTKGGGASTQPKYEQTLCEGGERVILIKQFTDPICNKSGFFSSLLDWIGGDRNPERPFNDSSQDHRYLADLPCTNPDHLCSGKAFAWGGVDPETSTVGVTISSVKTAAELVDPSAGKIRLISSVDRPPIMQVMDLDSDGFSDIQILLTMPVTPESEEVTSAYRLLRSVKAPIVNEPKLGVSKSNKNVSTTPAPSIGAPNIQKDKNAVFALLEKIRKWLREEVPYWTRRLLVPSGRSGSDGISRGLREFAFDNDLGKGVTTCNAGRCTMMYNGLFTELSNQLGRFDFVAFVERSEETSFGQFSPVYVIKQKDSSSNKMFEMANLGTNYFLKASCKGPVATHTRRKVSGSPFAGACIAFTVTEMDGWLTGRRQVIAGTAGLYQELNKGARPLHYGLGTSNNYIEGFFVGVPPTVLPAEIGEGELSPATRQLQMIDDITNSTTSIESTLMRKMQDVDPHPRLPAMFSQRSWMERSLTRKWVAVIPNMEVVADVSSYVDRPSLWRLEISVNPGKQAWNIALGTSVSLVMVGIAITILNRKEQLEVGKERQGFKSRFVMLA